jgi:hypothetical protein
VLTAIDPDTEAIDTVHTAGEVAAFIGKYNNTRNLYYSVNPTRTANGATCRGQIRTNEFTGV